MCRPDLELTLRLAVRIAMTMQMRSLCLSLVWSHPGRVLGSTHGSTRPCMLPLPNTLTKYRLQNRSSSNNNNISQMRQRFQCTRAQTKRALMLQGCRKSVSLPADATCQARFANRLWLMLIHLFLQHFQRIHYRLRSRHTPLQQSHRRSSQRISCLHLSNLLIHQEPLPLAHQPSSVYLIVLCPWPRQQRGPQVPQGCFPVLCHRQRAMYLIWCQTVTVHKLRLVRCQCPLERTASAVQQVPWHHLWAALSPGPAPAQAQSSFLQAQHLLLLQLVCLAPSLRAIPQVHRWRHMRQVLLPQFVP